MPDVMRGLKPKSSSPKIVFKMSSGFRCKSLHRPSEYIARPLIIPWRDVYLITSFHLYWIHYTSLVIEKAEEHFWLAELWEILTALLYKVHHELNAADSRKCVYA